MNILSRKWATGREIESQPQVWRGLSDQLPVWAEEVRQWIEERNPDEIWLSGAGTSSFLGEALADVPGLGFGRRLRSVASTDLVATPYAFFRKGLRPLVVSVGRSGNSSESIGVLDLLDRFAPDADRLHITCNGDSALAHRLGSGPGAGKSLVLPASTHDQGFAMTASFSTMYYTVLACLSKLPAQEIKERLARASAGAEMILAEPLSDLGFGWRPERLVFLGAGPLKAAARENALKILELTAGQVSTLWDSPLGFRHGPKSFVTPDTRIVVLRSRHPITAAYDEDLVEELVGQFGSDAVVSFGPNHATYAGLPLFPEDAWNLPLFVLPAQMAGAAWAEELGLNVDDPFKGRGTLTRVVSGVRLHTGLGW